MHGIPIMVTGGAGFIGSHACKALASAGYMPVVVDNLSTGHADSVKWGPYYNIDVRDTPAILRVIARYDIQGVMHFAASAYVGESVEDPQKYYDNNVGGMLSLLSACAKASVRELIFSSSCATYGIPDQLPITENSPQHPINPYGRTKLIGEHMLMDYAARYGFSYGILRYFNACGADPDGDLAERHDPETHLIPLALMSASGLRGALQVFGTDYDTPDGSCVRDYIHVSDLARGHVMAMQHLLQGGPSLTLNLGSGRGYSVLEVAQAVKQVSGRKVPLTLTDRRPGDPPSLMADPTQAQRLLGFKTERSALDQIICDAAPYFGLALEEVNHA
ncbi:UDP-galactose 4-epimerase [Actibacterium atlanticum]|uniref:UDP-glucose 4-epimerase n=1 Tax=Actibacterium atlanticum TaxID=1461693 RepID=A0A058ZI15_9RHOB|nr:UDP-galactose 4-epimerase [Actibacterium atlanticum]